MKKLTVQYLRFFLAWVKQSTILFLIAILVVGMLLRVTNTPDRFGFDKDPTRDALVAIYGAENLEFPLIGPHSGLGGFTFGPWYYYELILVKLIFQNPSSPFYFIIFSSVVFIVTMYFLGKTVKDKTLGVILASLAAYSPAQTGASNGLSNPNLVAVHAAAAVIIFFLFLQKKLRLRWSFAWGLIIGIGMNHHYQMFPLLFLPLIAYTYRWRTAFKHVFVFGLGLLAAFLPLLLFNIQADWHTVRGFWSFFLSGGASYVPNSWTIYVRDFWPQFWAYVVGVPVWLGVLVAMVVVGSHGFLLWKRKLSHAYILALISFVIMFVVLRYYKGHREYYYLFYLHPFLLLFFGYAIRIFWQQRVGKGVVILLGLILFVLALPHNRSTLTDNGDQLRFRSEAAELKAKFPGEKLQIFTCKDVSNNHSQGIVFHLYQTHSLSERGRKIAPVDSRSTCERPSKAEELGISNLYDISGTSPQELESHGWWSVTPESVYKRTVLWWKDRDK